MEIVLISSQMDKKNNVLQTTVGMPIAIITASVVKKDKNNILTKIETYNKNIKLKLIDDNGNTKPFLKGITTTRALNGNAFFLTCSITKPGNWILVAEAEDDEPYVKNALLLTSISFNYLSLQIKYDTVPAKLLPNVPYAFKIKIVDVYGNEADFSNHASTPNLKMAINEMPDIVNLATGERVSSFEIEPDENSTYKFLFTAKKPGIYYIYSIAYDSLTGIRNVNINASFITFNVIFNNNNACASVIENINYNFSHGLSHSSYMDKKIELVNKTHTRRTNNRMTPFETGLTASQCLNYKITNPQEHSSVPISVDNSRGGGSINDSYFNPRVRPPFPNAKTEKTALYDITASGLTCGSSTNMIKMYAEQTGPNTFIKPDTLRMSDLIKRNKIKATIENTYSAKQDTFNTR